MVYSIIKQHRGFIHVVSRPGTGTTFKIYLPFISMKEEILEKAELTAIPSGNETILLAEDDHALRRILKIFLEDYGYKVLEAVNGEDALTIFSENSAGINLILTDMVMPKMPGNTVYKKARMIRPDVKCLFMSGYSSDIIRKIGFFKEEINYISKPISPYSLLRKVREVLDS